MCQICVSPRQCWASIDFRSALYNQIEALAKATARTKSFLKIDALTNYVPNEAWQVRDIEAGIQEANAGEFATEQEVAAMLNTKGMRFPCAGGNRIDEHDSQRADAHAGL